MLHTFTYFAESLCVYVYVYVYVCVCAFLFNCPFSGVLWSGEYEWFWHLHTWESGGFCCAFIVSMWICIQKKMPLLLWKNACVCVRVCQRGTVCVHGQKCVFLQVIKNPYYVYILNLFKNILFCFFEFPSFLVAKMHISKIIYNKLLCILNGCSSFLINLF